MDASMWAFGQSERMNRVATIWAGVETLGGVNGLTEDQFEDVMKRAKEMSDKAHGVYGKANRPYIARGTNPAARVFQSFYVFQTFVHNYWNTMVELGFSRKQRKAALWMAVTPSILAGATASLPVSFMVNIVGKMLNPGDDPEEAFYNYLTETHGDMYADLARYGLAGMGGNGINMKGSLANMAHIPTTLGDLLGAPGSVVFDVWKGGKDISEGNVWKGLEKISPLALQHPMRGWREYKHGLTTGSNTPIYWGDEQAHSEGHEFALRVIGFNPARTAKIKEVQWHERKNADGLRKERARVYAKIRKYTEMPEGEQKRSKWAEILLEIEDYNAMARRNTTGEPLITGKSISQNLKRTMEPTKRERLRQRNIDRRAQVPSV